MSNSTSISRLGFIRTAGVAGAAASASIISGSKMAWADENAWDEETDVVIVGYGGAGACAAIEAADEGAEVIIIEKSAPENHLNNTNMSGGGWHSPDPDGDPDALREYLKAMFSGDNLPSKTEGEQSPLFVDDIVDKFAKLEPENVDFMASCDPDLIPIFRSGSAFPNFPGADECGYQVFLTSYNDSPFNQDFPTIDLPKEETAGGLAFFNALKTGVEDRADAISVEYSTPGQDLVQADDGTVIGVVAERDGSPWRIKARKAVILTAGGYEYNPEMRRAFLEGPGITGWAFYGTTANTGDGIRMGIKAGAQLAKVGKAAARLIWACPDITCNGLPLGAQTDTVGSNGTIVVNAEGNRFMNEALITKDPSRYFSYKNAVHMDITTLEYPNIPAYMIIDEKRRQQGPLVNINQASTGFGLIPWDADNQTAIDNGWLIKADTIEELAEKIRDTHDLNRGRMSPENLKATMEKYAKMVETGEDPDFGRSSKTIDIKTLKQVGDDFQPIDTPPFYALPLVAGGPNSKGGLQADGDRHVIDWENKPIPHLYTAGEMSSVFKFVYQGGGNLTECIVCGRIAGRNAAAETPWEE